MAKITGDFKFFKAIDELMFKLVDEFTASPTIKKINDEIEALPENQQKLINQILSFVIIALPFVLVMSLFFSNRSIRQSNLLKQEVLKIYTSNNSEAGQIGSLGQSLIGPTPLESSESFQQILRSVQTNRSINMNSINVSHFENISMRSDLQQSIIGLSFSELTTQDFTNLVSDLIQRQRVKVQAIEIEKNPSTKFLQGSLEILSFHRVNP